MKKRLKVGIFTVTGVLSLGVVTAAIALPLTHISVKTPSEAAQTVATAGGMDYGSTSSSEALPVTSTQESKGFISFAVYLYFKFRDWWRGEGDVAPEKETDSGEAKSVSAPADSEEPSSIA